MVSGKNDSKTNGSLEDSDQDVELNPATQDLIGRHLKAHYDALISAPMPDKFLMLLAMLEAKETGQPV